jgi:hypothetical protein
MQMSPQVASQSAASAFRVQSAEVEVQPKLYARAPVIQLPKGLSGEDRTLLIVRSDRKGERHALKIDDATAAAGFYDLAKSKVSLTRGAIYDVSVGGHAMKFKIAANAKSGPTPVVSRLVRFQ